MKLFSESTEIFPFLLLKPPYICAFCTCNAVSLKKVNKMFFKEDESALPL